MGIIQKLKEKKNQYCPPFKAKSVFALLGIIQKSKGSFVFSSFSHKSNKTQNLKQTRNQPTQKARSCGV